MDILMYVNVIPLNWTLSWKTEGNIYYAHKVFYFFYNLFINVFISKSVYMQIHYSIYIKQFTCFQLNFYLCFINFYRMETNFPIQFVYIHHLKYWLARNSNIEVHHSFSYYCFKRKKNVNTLCFIIISFLTIQILICNI